MSILHEYNTPEQKELLFASYCEKGMINEAGVLLKQFPTINVHTHSEYPFRAACRSGKINSVMWLWKYCLLHETPIDIHIYDDYPYRICCKKGYTDLCIWIYKKCNGAIDF